MDDLTKRVKTLEINFALLKQKRIKRRDVVPNEIKQRHIDGKVIFRGNSIDLPSDGSTEIQAFYAFDQKKLYIWNTTNDAWESASFT